MYFRARYYHPQLGQFLSRDPLGYVDGMSQYRAYFVPGAVDPLGLVCRGKCGTDNGGNYQYIGGRGSFVNLSFADVKVIKEKQSKSLKSSFGALWQPSPKKFMENDRKCCTEIGTFQIVKGVLQRAKWTDNKMLDEHTVTRVHRTADLFADLNEYSNLKDWGPDGTLGNPDGYPYEDNYPEFNTSNPFIGTHSFSDSPGDNVRYVPWINSVKYLSQDFEFCVVCLAGDEVNAVYLSLIHI